MKNIETKNRMSIFLCPFKPHKFRFRNWQKEGLEEFLLVGEERERIQRRMDFGFGVVPCSLCTHRRTPKLQFFFLK